MAQSEETEERAAYKRIIEMLQLRNEALSAKAQALEALHDALLSLKGVREQFPEIDIVKDKPVPERKPNDEGTEKTMSVLNPIRVKRKYNKRINQEPNTSHNQLKGKPDSVKDKLMKIYGYGNKTSGQLADVLIYLHAHNNTDMETLAKKLSMGSGSLYRYVGLLKDNGLIDAVGTRGSIRYIITNNGLNLVKVLSSST